MTKLDSGLLKKSADRKEGHDASRLFKMGKERAGKRPDTMITDGLRSYADAFGKEIYEFGVEGS